MTGPIRPPTPPKRKPQHHEAAEQRMFVARFRVDPSTRDLPACAIPNGGRRNPREAARMKAEGVSAGAPDWVLFAARHGYHGLAIEFKSPTGSGRLSPAQQTWHQALRGHGYCVAIATSAAIAWDLLTDYLTDA